MSVAHKGSLNYIQTDIQTIHITYLNVLTQSKYSSVDLTTTTEMKLKSSVFLPDDVTVDQIVFEDEKTTTSATATKSLDATEAGIDEQAPTDLVSATNMSRDSENTIRTVENDDVDENTTGNNNNIS